MCKLSSVVHSLVFRHFCLNVRVCFTSSKITSHWNVNSHRLGHQSLSCKYLSHCQETKLAENITEVKNLINFEIEMILLTNSY